MHLQKEKLLKELKLLLLSRHASLIGRKEVLGGKAKFGIFGDGKELPQIVLSDYFQKGDWRSGYYRDQTLMFALGVVSVKQFFAQLFADTNEKNEPASAGRQMNSHFASRFLDEKANWLDQTSMYNVSSDISPTGGQMARLVGLGYASKLYNKEPGLQDFSGAKLFSNQGKEIAFGTIGNASTSEGLFWESLNAMGVLEIPVVMSVWDDEYGISVHNTYQTVKGSISEALAGFHGDETLKGVRIFKAKGYDYLELHKVYKEATEYSRKHLKPSLVHITHLTQPQGHSTSGSHERYKSKERLDYEQDMDCLKMFKSFLIAQGFIDEISYEKLFQSTQKEVEKLKDEAWDDFQNPILKERDNFLSICKSVDLNDEQLRLVEVLEKKSSCLRRDISSCSKQLLFLNPNLISNEIFLNFLKEDSKSNKERYESCLYNLQKSPLNIPKVEKEILPSGTKVDGRQVIQKYFESKLSTDKRIFIIGEDVGQLGGVNLEFDGLQDTFGKLRVTDTGIREATILGQGIGAALRGLRPIVDIQYLDYLIYALQGMSDDLASLHYRTKGGQACPVIVRTKGHRLEGIWHSGSPMGMLIHSLQGMHICVPRDCVQAAGMYETLFQGDDPALVIEVLNGYRVKETLPENLGQYTVPLGEVEVLKEGSDLTIVTYGACVRVALEAANLLEKMGILVEVIDVQTLLPFDRTKRICASLQKTHSVLFFDEDVPGGATSYMMQQVLEVQNAFDYLDSAPRTLSATKNRSPYASDGDYYTKPNREDVVAVCYSMMHERYPIRFLDISF